MAIDTVEAADILAAGAHDGQVDKAGVPYIDHLRVVREIVAEHGGGVAEQIAALLHDVIAHCDHTGLTLAGLAERGVPAESLQILDVLTRRPGEHYLRYLVRVRDSVSAGRVKLAAITDNDLPERLALLEPCCAGRLHRKYVIARWVLLNVGRTCYLAQQSDGDPVRGLVPYDELWRLTGQVWEYFSPLTEGWHQADEPGPPYLPEVGSLVPMDQITATGLSMAGQLWASHWAEHRPDHSSPFPWLGLFRRRRSPDEVCDEKLTPDGWVATDQLPATMPDSLLDGHGRVLVPIDAGQVPGLAETLWLEGAPDQ